MIRTFPKVLFMTKRINSPIVKVTTKVVVLKRVKVKAYKRVRFGKLEQVKSHLSGRRVAHVETTITVSK